MNAEAQRPTPAAYRICDLPERLRPREEIERAGVAHVGDDTLLAVLIGKGARGVNAKQLAERLLLKYKSLTALAGATVDELTRDRNLPGLGRVKALTLKAALELARRMSEEQTQALGGTIRSPAEAATLLREAAKPLDYECFWVLPLDAKNRFRGALEPITKGILDATLVHPREVFKAAIQRGSARLVVVHNHPSGDPTPSAEDLRITRQLIDSGRVLGIEVLDHVILGRSTPDRPQDFLSLREAGVVSFESTT